MKKISLRAALWVAFKNAMKEFKSTLKYAALQVDASKPLIWVSNTLFIETSELERRLSMRPFAAKYGSQEDVIFDDYQVVPHSIPRPKVPTARSLTPTPAQQASLDKIIKPPKSAVAPSES